MWRRHPPRPPLFPYTTLFRSRRHLPHLGRPGPPGRCTERHGPPGERTVTTGGMTPRSEEHTSELQSRGHLVCRVQLEKHNEAPLEDRGRAPAPDTETHVAARR